MRNRNCQIWKPEEKKRVQPKLNYRAANNDMKPLNKNKVYDAIVASNQPNYKEDGLIFVGNYLLKRGEYTIVKGGE